MLACNAVNGIGNQQFSIDPLRENPTLGYDALDGDDDFSFDGDNSLQENVIPLLPRADILMFVANLLDERSKVDDSIKSDGSVMIVYNHAELGRLRGGSRITVDLICKPGDDFGDCDHDSTDDWSGGLSLIPVLQAGGGMDPGSDVQDIARDKQGCSVGQAHN